MLFLYVNYILEELPYLNQNYYNHLQYLLDVQTLNYHCSHQVLFLNIFEIT